MHHNQEHHTDKGKHPECLFLPIPQFRLPHQKPFASDIEECHQPHQQARRQRNDGNVQRSGELRPCPHDTISATEHQPTSIEGC